MKPLHIAIIVAIITTAAAVFFGIQYHNLRNEIANADPDTTALRKDLDLLRDNNEQLIIENEALKTELKSANDQVVLITDNASRVDSILAMQYDSLYAANKAAAAMGNGLADMGKKLVILQAAVKVVLEQNAELRGRK